MFVVAAIWLISVFANTAIVYPGTVVKIDVAKDNTDSSNAQRLYAKRRRYLELNITVWTFLALVSFAIVFVIILLPLSEGLDQTRAYVLGVSTSFQLGFLGSIAIYLLFVNHLQPSMAASVAIWLVGLILSVAIIIYDVIVLQFADDALDLASRIFVYSTLTSWLLFVIVNWIAVFFMYKKYMTVSNGRRQKCERYMTPRMYVQFLNLKEKLRQLLSANIFLSLSWIPFVLHVIIMGLSMATDKSDTKLAYEFDWREKLTLGTTLTIVNTLIVPLIVLVNEETRLNIMRSFFPDSNNNKEKLASSHENRQATNDICHKPMTNYCHYSCREISNVGLVNIPEMCLTDSNAFNKHYKQRYESDA